MPYTEIRKVGTKTYYYRAKSIRDAKKVNKIKTYLGVNLSGKELILKEAQADYTMDDFSSLLSKEQVRVLYKLKQTYARLSRQTQQQRYEAFCSLFTHSSTAIEGNTITLQETAQLLFEHRAPAKSVPEINEVSNHKRAFDVLLTYAGDFDKKFILEMHAIVMRDTVPSNLTDQIGAYRKSQVYIRGVKWLPTPADHVQHEMANLLRWYTRNKEKIHPVIAASYVHCMFEYIHPFIDGNGRVGRLLLNFMLHRSGFPMVNISDDRKHEYYIALEKAQVHHDFRPFVLLLYRLLTEQKIQY